MNKVVLNDLFDYENRKIYQNTKGFKFSLDSILLYEFVNKTNKMLDILDICTGNGVIPLLFSYNNKYNIVGFEIQKEVCDLASNSIDYNKVQDNIKLINDDIKNIDKYYKGKTFNIITCNPPFFKTDGNTNINDNYSLAVSRHEILIDLETIFEISSSHLNDGGEFYLVHRPERLDEIIILGNKYNLNVKKVQLVATKDDNKPSTVLIKCVKNSKNGVIIKPVVNVNKLHTYKRLFEEKK